MGNIFAAAKKISDSFFDGLMNNLEKKAFEKAKKNKKAPSPLIKRMSQLDKASKEIDEMLKDLGEE